MNLPPQHLGASLAQRTQQDAQVTSNVNANLDTLAAQNVAAAGGQARDAMTAANSAAHGQAQADQAAVAEQMQRSLLEKLPPEQLVALRHKQLAAREIGATSAMEALGQHILLKQMQGAGLA